METIDCKWIQVVVRIRQNRKPFECGATCKASVTTDLSRSRRLKQTPKLNIAATKECLITEIITLDGGEMEKSCKCTFSPTLGVVWRSNSAEH